MYNIDTKFGAIAALSRDFGGEFYGKKAEWVLGGSFFGRIRRIFTAEARRDGGFAELCESYW